MIDSQPIDGSNDHFLEPTFGLQFFIIKCNLHSFLIIKQSSFIFGTKTAANAGQQTIYLAKQMRTSQFMFDNADSLCLSLLFNINLL